MVFLSDPEARVTAPDLKDVFDHYAGCDQLMRGRLRRLTCSDGSSTFAACDVKAKRKEVRERNAQMQLLARVRRRCV